MSGYTVSEEQWHIVRERQIWAKWELDHSCAICDHKNSKTSSNLFCDVHYKLWMERASETEYGDDSLAKFVDSQLKALGKPIPVDPTLLASSPWIYSEDT